MMVVFVKNVFCESSSFLQKCIYSHIGCICKNVLVSPQPSYKSAFEVTLVAFVKKIVSPHASTKKAFVATLVAFGKTYL